VLFRSIIYNIRKANASFKVFYSADCKLNSRKMTTEIATNVDPNQQKQQIDTANLKQQQTRQNSAESQQIVSPQTISLKNPLENSWSFWFFKNEKQKEWKENLVFITTVDFVEDFWGVYNHLQPVSKLNQGCDYMFFKKDIQPMWEDAQNRDGGRWVINIDKKSRASLLDSYWLNTLLALIGDQFFDDSPSVNGAYINIRSKGDRLSLWTKTARDNDLQHRIGDKFREVLSLRENILSFEPHEAKK